MVTQPTVSLYEAGGKDKQMELSRWYSIEGLNLCHGKAPCGTVTL